MDNTSISILIARMIGIIYLSVAISMVLNKVFYKKIIDDLFNNAGLTYISGFFTTIMGFLIINYHNIWVLEWVTLITLIGWIALIKGISIIIFPTYVHKISKSIINSSINIIPIIICILGLVFLYIGFFM